MGALTTVVVCALAVMIAGVGGVIAIKLTSLLTTVAAEPSVSLSPSPSAAAIATTTKVGDQSRDRADFLEIKINEVLRDQAKALLAQNQEAYLQPAKEPAARDRLLMLYRNLTAMHVTRFEMKTSYVSVDTANGRWQAQVEISFCFVVTTCVTDKITEPTVWTDTAEGPLLFSTEAAMKGNGWFGDPQPWEVSALEVAVGTRVLVATTASLKHRLSSLLKAAEEATAVADTFSIGPKPDLYRVYLADKNEWKTWYGNEPPKWSAGYAKTIGATHTDVVLNNTHSKASFLPDLLRHELTHSSTLQGSHRWENNWWLIEGIADLAEHPDRLTERDWLAATRSYARGRWNKKLPAVGPADNASYSDVGAQYGVAFLAVKRLDVRFGREKLLLFFERVIEYNDSYEKASTTIFGVPWADAEADCVSYIRRY